MHRDQNFRNFIDALRAEQEQVLPVKTLNWKRAQHMKSPLNNVETDKLMSVSSSNTGLVSKG